LPVSTATQRLPLRLAAIYLAIASSGIPAQTPSRLLTVEVVNVPVSMLAAQVADATGRKIVVAANVHGQVSLKPGAPVTAGQLYAAFLGVLKASGYALEERDGMLLVGAKP